MWPKYLYTHISIYICIYLCGNKSQPYYKIYLYIYIYFICLGSMANCKLITSHLKTRKHTRKENGTQHTNVGITSLPKWDEGKNDQIFWASYPNCVFWKIWFLWNLPPPNIYGWLRIPCRALFCGIIIN